MGDTDAVLRAYWARLDDARVVGNVNDAGGDFWRMAPAAQRSRLALLESRSGARAAVSDEPQARLAGWTRSPERATLTGCWVAAEQASAGMPGFGYVLVGKVRNCSET